HWPGGKQDASSTPPRSQPRSRNTLPSLAPRSRYSARDSFGLLLSSRQQQREGYGRNVSRWLLPQIYPRTPSNTSIVSWSNFSYCRRLRVMASFSNLCASNALTFAFEKLFTSGTPRCV